MTGDPDPITHSKSGCPLGTPDSPCLLLPENWLKGGHILTSFRLLFLVSPEATTYSSPHQGHCRVFRSRLAALQGALAIRRPNPLTSQVRKHRPDSRDND